VRASPEGDVEHFETPRGKLALWTGFLGGALAWTAQLLAGYAVSRFSHEHPWLTGVHHGISLVATALAVAATLLAWREWRRLGGGESRGSEPGVAGRSRFLALLGVVTSGLFAVVIVAQWVPVFFIDPAWY
jgi:hypothetical protein